MGVLDDAIRDHLELKRRHGADPGEVAHLERRALGPDADALPGPPRDELSSDGADAATTSPRLHGEPQPPGEAAGMPAPTDEHAVAVEEMAESEPGEERSGGFAAVRRGSTSEETIEIDVSSLTPSDGGGTAAAGYSEDR